MNPWKKFGTTKNKTMISNSKIRVYTNGIVKDDIGSYAYIVLENNSAGILETGNGGGRVFSPTILKAKFAQAGKTDKAVRMQMRAVYEGVRHCPDGSDVEIYTDNFLMDHIIETTQINEEDGDIADRYRRYIAEHRIIPHYNFTKVYNGNDLPDNDHDEWTWYAHWLCENEIKRFKKGNK